MTQLKITDKNQISDILEMHNSMIPIAHIAKKYGVYSQNIQNVLKKYIGYSPNSLSLKNINYFSEIDTPIKAYLSGFIAADGAIVGKELTITIHSKDRIVLDVLKSELESTNDIQTITKDGLTHVRFVTTNENITQDLSKYGIGPNKSLTMPNLIENIPYEFRNSFILGYFDGDGSINVREVFINKRHTRKQSIQIRATKELALGIVSHLGIQSYHLTDETMPNLNISSLEEVRSFYNQVYSQSPIFLSRKRDKFLIALYRQINKSSYRELYDQHISQGQTISSSY